MRTPPAGLVAWERLTEPVYLTMLPDAVSAATLRVIDEPAVMLLGCCSMTQWVAGADKSRRSSNPSRWSRTRFFVAR